MLNQAGHPCELRIGAANGADELIAHAWVESEGRVVIGEIELDRYAPLKGLHVQSGKSPLPKMVAVTRCAGARKMRRIFALRMGGKL